MPISAKEILVDPEMRQLVRGLHDVGFVRWSDASFTLKSGVPSHVYVYGREDLTDNPDVLARLGSVIARRLEEEIPVPAGKKLCLIGIPTAGTPLAQAAADGSDGFIIFRIMREMKKEYGAHGKTIVNGRPDPARHVYATIDNVVTDGESKIEAAKLLREDGYPADDMIHVILVDRGNGGVERLRREGLKVVVIFNLTDLIEVFVESERWSPAQAQALKDEIAAHQV